VDYKLHAVAVAVGAEHSEACRVCEHTTFIFEPPQVSNGSTRDNRILATAAEALTISAWPPCIRQEVASSIH